MFILLGINHNTASLDVREKVAFAPEQLLTALKSLRKAAGAEGAAILSTCNRTELFLDGENLEASEVQGWLVSWHQLEASQLSQCTYEYCDEEAAFHMMRVASGLDSLVLGEPQILGQLKSAYAVAEEADTLSSGLHQVFQHTFSSAKRVRSETAIGQNPVSVAYAAVSLARQIFAQFDTKTALLIGAGETIALVGRHLKEQGISRIVIANRTLARAEELAVTLGSECILLSDIPDFLHQVDIVFSSTASQLPLLGKGAVESALRRRKRRMMFMVDLAVPRDIEVEVGALEDVYLYTVDDLSEVIEENRRSREQAAEEAETLIKESLQRWQQERNASGHAQLIKDYRDTVDTLRNHELDKALTLLDSGLPAEEVMKRFSMALTNKIMHQPTSQLKWITQSDDLQLIDMAKRILGLDETQSLSSQTADLANLAKENLPPKNSDNKNQVVDKEEPEL